MTLGYALAVLTIENYQNFLSRFKIKFIDRQNSLSIEPLLLLYGHRTVILRLALAPAYDFAAEQAYRLLLVHALCSSRMNLQFSDRLHKFYVTCVNLRQVTSHSKSFADKSQVRASHAKP